jgi:3-hydroxyisobutyrate dehydrogenase-like beta-hydroxyacid dehydrogenase
VSDIRVGVAGLGRMGRAIAARLAGQGFRVSGWTRSGVDAGEASRLGIAACDGLPGLAASADILVLSLFDDAAVTSVVRALAALDLRGKVLVDTSTVGPDTLRAEHARIGAAGASAIDAPVAGGPDMILAGTAGFYIGGAPSDVERFTPVARAMASRILVIGGPGAGAAAKMVNNMMLLGYWQTLKEALQVGRAAGLGYEAMLEMLAGSPAASAAFVQRLPVFLGQSEEVGFTVDGVVKDATLFAETARSLGVPVPAIEASLASFIAHSERGHGAADVVTMVRAACLPG